MGFYEVLDQVVALLRQRGRVTYRALKREFQLDDAFLEDLKDELIKAQHLAVDEQGEVLIWAGGSAPAPAPGTPVSPVTPRRERSEWDAVAVTASSASPRSAEAERRQLTVLFCDLVDSTILAGQLDPEDLREVICAYQAACATVIERVGGHIAQYLGDGLLVYFGYPQAHEDDAQRAVRTGLGMVAAMVALNTELAQRYRVQIAVRIGIHTGLAVVGDVGGGRRHEQLALGDTPNLAARLQGLAAPDTVVLSAATFRLVQGYFTSQDMGAHRLKGVAAPVHVYRMLGESGVQSRLEPLVQSRLTPLVGREEEVVLLQQRWGQAKVGLGQVVLLSGEAGIGKSRLVQVLKDAVAHEPHARIEWRGSPYHQQSALYPVIAHLHRLLWRREDEPPQEQLRTLETLLSSAGLVLAEVMPLLAALLSLPLPARYPLLTLTPQRQRQKTLETLQAWLDAEAKQQPVLLIVEDLHWIDPSTLELLSLLIDQVASARCCLVLTARPEFHPPWAIAAHLTPLTLRRLAPAQVMHLASHVGGDKALPSAVLQEIVRKTDGVPLFVEELTKVVLDSGLLQEREDHYDLPSALPPLAIPATLHDALMARLDRLAAAKLVAQLGAVIGRTFAYDLIQTVALLDTETLQGALAQLVDAELVVQRGLPPQATYTFKHALIQDAAYQSLLKSTRQQYHQRIAQVLAERFPELCETQPELLAHHYTEAGLSEQSLGYWQQAGERAVQRSAHVEGISHLMKGLAILKTLPEMSTQAQHELALLTALGPALMATQGQGSSEVEATYARARELCRHVGDTPQLTQVLQGLRRFYVVQGDYKTARELGSQLLTQAQRQDDPALFLPAHEGLGTASFYLGAFVAARDYCEQGIALYAAQRHQNLALHYGLDPGMQCLSYAAWTLWMLGYPDQARTRMDQALTLAQELMHPISLARVLHFAAVFAQCRREVQVTQARAEAAITLSTEQGFALWLAGGTMMQGWALATQGQREEGMVQLRHGLATWQATGAAVSLTYYLALLADAYRTEGQADRGLGVVAEALALVDKHEERWWEAELHRLRDELVLAYNGEHAAEAASAFQHALAIARQQHTKALELRAATSLGRLWQQQGKRAAARELLAPIYTWFTEGFDTADLQEAKILLEELS